MEEREYGAPPQIEPKVLGDYLDVMSQSVFQSGMSWRVVKAKWPGTREVFHNFDALRVASLSGAEIAAIQPIAVLISSSASSLAGRTLGTSLFQLGWLADIQQCSLRVF